MATTGIQWKKAVSTKYPDLVVDLEISNMGDVKNIVSKRIFKPQMKDNHLCTERQGKRIFLRHLVAETFLRPMAEGDQVYCMDNDFKNVRASNLGFKCPATAARTFSKSKMITADYCLKHISEIEGKLSDLTDLITDFKCLLREINEDKTEPVAELNEVICPKSGA